MLISALLLLILLYFILIGIIDLFSLDIELAQLMHIVNHVVAHFDSLSCLLKSILVLVNLGQDGAVLQLQLADDKHFPHAVGDAFLLQVQHASRQVLKGMLDALGAFLKHLHLLVAQGHVVEHHEQVVLISTTRGEIYCVHNAIGFLK